MFVVKESFIGFLSGIVCLNRFSKRALLISDHRLGKITRMKHFISHTAQFSKVIKINYVFSFLSTRIITTFSQNKIMSNCSDGFLLLELFYV